jgi:DNA polymerase-3 subunit alpha
MKKVAVANSLPIADNNEEGVEGEMETQLADVVMTDVEDVQVITKLSMPSRKLKVRISNDLLQELEKLQVNFKLN